MIFEDFTEPLDKHWIQTCIGGGKLYLENTTLRMAFDSARQGMYTDAQIDDYGHLKRSDFPWRPPLRMRVIARSSLPAATLRNYHRGYSDSTRHCWFRLLELSVFGKRGHPDVARGYLVFLRLTAL